MKTTAALFIALMSTSVLAGPRVGEIVPCSSSLKAIASKQACRSFGPNQVSIWDAKNNYIHVEENKVITKIQFPQGILNHKLSLQGGDYGGYDFNEGFYNNVNEEWVVFKTNSDIEYVVSIIGKDQLEGSGPITELVSRANKIHLNISFEKDLILVQSDDKKTTLEVKRDKRPIAELITEGMNLYLADERFPDVSFYALTLEWYNKCKLDEKCLEKVQKDSLKALSKKYKKEGNKEAAKSIISSSNPGYNFNQLKELLDGCLTKPQGSMNPDGYYRVNFNLDNGEKSLSQNQYEPGNFSILMTYVILKPTVTQRQ